MASPISPTANQSNLPTRSLTNDPDEAIPDEDSSETTKLFHERLQGPGAILLGALRLVDVIGGRLRRWKPYQILVALGRGWGSRWPKRSVR